MSLLSFGIFQIFYKAKLFDSLKYHLGIWCNEHFRENKNVSDKTQQHPADLWGEPSGHRHFWDLASSFDFLSSMIAINSLHLPPRKKRRKSPNFILFSPKQSAYMCPFGFNKSDEKKKILHHKETRTWPLSLILKHKPSLWIFALFLFCSRVSGYGSISTDSAWRDNDEQMTQVLVHQAEPNELPS